MTSPQSQITVASNSLNAAWSVALGESEGQVEQSVDTASLSVADVLGFVTRVESHVKEWGQLFMKVPNEHERRKEALGGALKLKSAAKQLEKVTASLSDTKGDTVNGSEETTSETKEVDATSNLADSLFDVQAAFHEIVLGYLEVSFPVDELIVNDEFKDSDAISVTKSRMQVVADLASALGNLFRKGTITPKDIAGGNKESLAPEVLKMLEKQMKKQKKKEKKQGRGAPDTHAINLEAAKALWEQTDDGRCSGLLGAEIWEGLNWRRGIFLADYIHRLLVKSEQDEKKEETEVAEKAILPALSESETRELIVDAMQSFHRMLIAQGPIPADQDDPAQWQTNSDGPHLEETPRMCYHGIYSSTHLRALKFMAELSYWQWKHCGLRSTDAKLGALINRKFAHIVRHIMPHAGWTADVEADRAVEMEKASKLDSA